MSRKMSAGEKKRAKRAKGTRTRDKGFSAFIRSYPKADPETVSKLAAAKGLKITPKLVGMVRSRDAQGRVPTSGRDQKKSPGDRFKGRKAAFVRKHPNLEPRLVVKRAAQGKLVFSEQYVKRIRTLDAAKAASSHHTTILYPTEAATKARAAAMKERAAVMKEQAEHTEKMRRLGEKVTRLGETQGEEDAGTILEKAAAKMAESGPSLSTDEKIFFAVVLRVGLVRAEALLKEFTSRVVGAL